MKKELILQRLAWGHLPDFMVAQELSDGTLIDIGCDILPGRTETIGLMRRRGARRGPVAEELWTAFSALLLDRDATSAPRATMRSATASQSSKPR
jgi:DNA-binding transcriptional LysR family regulator